MNIELTVINTENHPQFMNHETVYKMHSADINFTAFVGVHNTALGPSLGGIRFKHYASENDAIKDVLRLSEAMTWKNAAGGLEHGGGKSVIMAPEGQKTPDEQTLKAFADGLNQINAHAPTYFGAEDMNISETSLDVIQQTSQWIKGGTPQDPEIVGG